MSFKTAKRRLNSEGVPPWRKDSANLFGQSLSRLDHEVFKNQVRINKLLRSKLGAVLTNLSIGPQQASSETMGR